MPNSDLPEDFGPYTLLRRLAVGGMAEVYLASTKGSGGFEKLVALKRIHPQYSADESFVSMLIEEAKLSVLLSHRNIVQTFDLGCINGAYFIVMEHVEGYDAHYVLSALRESGRHFPIDLAAHVAAEVCRGLDYAHKRCDETGRPLHIVHRDVSPQNVLLSFAGEVKIADFGIAKARSRASDPEVGVIKGKYFYMSPEQAWGDPLDRRSDIFSAGVVLWELLVGETLHKAKDVQALLDAVRRAEVPPPSSLREGMSPELDAIIARATSVEPDQRYSNAEELADALCRYLVTRPTVNAQGEIREMLAGLDAPPPPAAPSDLPRGIPLTRDRVVTQPLEQRPTPPNRPMRFDLEDGEPTVAGWRSPQVQRRSRLLWWLALGAGSLLAGLALWMLRGS